MTRFIVSACYMFCAFSATQAGEAWQQAERLPAGTRLYDILDAGNSFIAVGEKGAVWRSQDGQTWFWQDAGSDQDLHSVISTAHGYFALGKAGTILTSQDGQSWKPVESGGYDPYEDVIWNGTQFMAVAGNGRISRSDKGRFWKRVAAPTEQRLTSLLWGGDQFTAAGFGNQVLTSEDGLAWTERVPYQPRTIIYSDIFQLVAGHGRLLAIGTTYRIVSGLPIFYPYVLTSSNGFSWEQVVIDGSRLKSIIYDGSDFLGVGEYQLYHSENGLDWEISQNPSDQVEVTAAILNNNDLYIVGREPLINRVRDGASETLLQRPPVTVRDLARGDEGDVVVGVAGNILFRAHGGNWRVVLNTDSHALEAVTWTGDVFLAAGADGFVTSSSNGLEWSPVKGRAGFNLLDIAEHDDVLVGVTDKGILSDGPGANWSLVQDGDYSAVLHREGRFLALGLNRICESSDGVNWSTVSANLGRVTDVAYGHGRYVVVEEYGRIAYSDDGVSWQTAVPTSDSFLAAVDFNGEVFRAVGDRVYESEDGIDWVRLDHAAVSTHYGQTVWQGEFLALGSNHSGGHLITSSVGRADMPVLVMPWVSNSNDFNSRVILNNFGGSGVNVSLQATRSNGEREKVTRFLPARGFMDEAASDLFAELGTGSGYSVMVHADKDQVRGRWVTGRNGDNNLAPSQGNAIALNQESNFRGTRLLFGYLPVEDGLLGVPVVLNTGTEGVDIILSFYSKSGESMAAIQVPDLAPNQPYPVLVGDFLPDRDETLQCIVTAPPGSELTGSLFLFDGDGQTAIANAAAIQD